MHDLTLRLARRAVALLAAIALLGAPPLLLPGCAGGPDMAGDARGVERATAYPTDAQAGPDLDVVVVRDGGQIQLVNRTARAYEGMQLWLNQRFVRPVDRVAIGGGNRYDLSRFVNRYGESFPTGSFLRPERSLRLVLAELYDPEAGVRYPLVVQPEEQPEAN